MHSQTTPMAMTSYNKPREITADFFCYKKNTHTISPPFLYGRRTRTERQRSYAPKSMAARPARGLVRTAWMQLPGTRVTNVNQWAPCTSHTFVLFFSRARSSENLALDQIQPGDDVGQGEKMDKRSLFLNILIICLDGGTLASRYSSYSRLAPRLRKNPRASAWAMG